MWVVLLLVIKYGRIIIRWCFRGVGDISKLFVYVYMSIHELCKRVWVVSHTGGPGFESWEPRGAS